MKIITTASEMETVANQYRLAGDNIGFVPTMGALHEGHVSLVRRAKSDNNRVVVSVFVNPTQFNEKSDLESYPRTFNADKDILKAENVDVMFFPSVDQVYPENESVSYEMDGLDKTMEGPNRPGHFNGVVQVVTRFFDLIKPTSAYFGEKDFQQLAIIRHMSRKLGYDINVVGCPTLREPNGLAMSSRNTRLTKEGKSLAKQIYASLVTIKSGLKNDIPIEELTSKAIVDLMENGKITLEYLEVVNPSTLNPSSEKDSPLQACIAAWIEGVRLIDNMRVK